MADDKRPKDPDRLPGRLPDRLPDLLVEKALLDELPAGTQLPAGSEARLVALREDGAATLEKHPPRRVAAEIERRLGHERRPARLWQLAWAPAALALVAAVAFGLRTQTPAPIPDGPGGHVTDPAGGDEVTLKGLAPELRVYRQDPRSDGHAERLRDGSVVRSGDVVQLSYLAAGRRAGVIVSIDGRGGTTLHHPAGPAAPALLVRSGEVPLARAYKLDDAPRFERFFFVTTADPAALDAAAVAAVLGAARRLAADPGAERALLALPAGLQQLSLLLRKEAP